MALRFDFAHPGCWPCGFCRRMRFMLLDTHWRPFHQVQVAICNSPLLTRPAPSASLVFKAASRAVFGWCIRRHGTTIERAVSKQSGGLGPWAPATLKCLKWFEVSEGHCFSRFPLWGDVASGGHEIQNRVGKWHADKAAALAWKYGERFGYLDIQMRKKSHDRIYGMYVKKANGHIFLLFFF